MSKKDNVKQVSLTKVDKYIKEFATKAFEYKPLKLNYPKEFTEMINEMDVQTRRSLPLFDVGGFVEDSANGCFVNIESEDGSIETRYAPYYRDIYIGKNILKYYTNIKEIDSIERLEKMVFGDSFGIVHVIKDSINIKQLDEIICAIDDLIEFKKQQLLNNEKSGLDELTNNLNNILKTIDKKIENFDVESLGEYVPEIVDIFKSGKLDPEKFASAFINAKAESVEDNVESEVKDGSKVVNIDSLKQ